MEIILVVEEEIEAKKEEKIGTNAKGSGVTASVATSGAVGTVAHKKYGCGKEEDHASE